MATINTRYIDPDAAAGGDGTTTALSGANCAYVSLSVWEAARQGDLASDDRVEKAVCQSTHASHTADTTALAIDGSTTDATRYLWITVADGSRHAGKWDDTKYRITCAATSGYRRTITIADPHVVIDGLQVAGTGAATEHICIFNNSGSNDGRVLIQNCICDMNVSSGTGLGIYCSYDTEIINCIILRATIGISMVNYNAGSSVAYNCTVHGCATGLYRYGNHTAVAINCAVFNNTDDFDGTMTVTYTASDDNPQGTGNVDISPGATEADDWAAAFTDYTNGDFSIKNTDSVLYHAGTDLNLTYDIAGNPWHATTPSIGAFEYVVSGGSGPKWNGITPAKWNGIDWSNLKWNGM